MFNQALNQTKNRNNEFPLPVMEYTILNSEHSPTEKKQFYLDKVS